MSRHPNNAIILTSITGERGPAGFPGSQGITGLVGLPGNQGRTGPYSFSKVDISFNTRGNGYSGIRQSSVDPDTLMGSLIFPGTLVANNVEKVRVLIAGKSTSSVSVYLKNENGDTIASGTSSPSVDFQILELTITGTFSTVEEKLDIYMGLVGEGLSISAAGEARIAFLEIR